MKRKALIAVLCMVMSVTLHAISEDELKAIGIDMDNLSASVPE